MKNRVAEVREKLLRAMAAYDAPGEFGITAEEYGEIVRRIESFDFSDESRWNGEEPREKDTLRELLTGPDLVPVFERHGWAKARDFLGELPAPEEGGEYAICFRLAGREEELVPFANVLLNLLLKRDPGKAKTLCCDMDASADGENHIWMFKKK